MLLTSVQFSCSVMSDSLWPPGLQHTTLPCPSPTPRTSSYSCPSSQWWHPTISSSVSPLSSCLQPFLASVKSLSCVRLFATPWTIAYHAPPSMGFSRQEYWSGLPFPSSIRVFSNESVLHIRWPKYWSFSFSINHSNVYSVLISFRTELFDLLAVLGTLKSLLQHQSSKASVLQCSTFFAVQLSHLYRTTGKTIALTIWTFASKVMPLLFSMQSKLVMAFLPRNKSP